MIVRTILSLTLALGLIAPALAQQDGKEIYAANCAACHQASGVGIKGAFPALAGDSLVLGEPAPLIRRVLQGKAGMPAFAASLSDEQIAATIGYIRSAWGNSAAPVTAGEVASARAATMPH